VSATTRACEHQAFTLPHQCANRCARPGMTKQPQECWRVEFETNVFFGRNREVDFVTPDFLAYRCLDAPYQDIRAKDVLLVGEVLSPSNTQTDMDEKRARYARQASPGIGSHPGTREERDRHGSRLRLETPTATSPRACTPLSVNYLLTGKWSPRIPPRSTSSPVHIHIPGPNSILKLDNAIGDRRVAVQVLEGWK